MHGHDSDYLFYQEHFPGLGEGGGFEFVEVDAGGEGGGVEGNFVSSGGFEFIYEGCHFPAEDVKYFKCYFA